MLTRSDATLGLIWFSIRFIATASRQGSGYTARLHVKNLIDNSVAFKVKYQKLIVYCIHVNMAASNDPIVQNQCAYSLFRQACVGATASRRSH
jgi:hypothetical protein